MKFKHTLGRWQIEYGTLWFPQSLAAEFRQVVPMGRFSLEIDEEIIAEELEADFINLSISVGSERMKTLFKGTEVLLVSSDLDAGRLILKSVGGGRVATRGSISEPSNSSRSVSTPQSIKSSESRTTTPSTPRNSELIFVDTETTGFSPYTDEVIEIAAIRVNSDFDELDRFQSYLIPHGPVKATHIHGLTHEFLLANGRPQEEVYCEFDEFLGDTLIAGHNVNYDLGMLQANGIRNNVNVRLRIGYDTLPHARSMLHLPSYKLERIVAALNLGDGKLKCHNALDDVLATIELAKHLRGVAKNR